MEKILEKIMKKVNLTLSKIKGFRRPRTEGTNMSGMAYDDNGDFDSFSESEGDADGNENGQVKEENFENKHEFRPFFVFFLFCLNRVSRFWASSNDSAK